jgi:hypothetical protein
MTAAILVAALLGVLPPTPTAPAQRVDLENLVREPIVNPGTPGDCDSYHDLAINAGWTEEQWPRVRYIINRESGCRPAVVNRYGCVGLMQVCRINHKRLGVTRADLKDPGTNLSIGRTLCNEWLEVGRSCYRPWWTRRFRP